MAINTVFMKGDKGEVSAQFDTEKFPKVQAIVSKNPPGHNAFLISNWKEGKHGVYPTSITPISSTSADLPNILFT